jgi:hypothetical protein
VASPRMNSTTMNIQGRKAPSLPLLGRGRYVRRSRPSSCVHEPPAGPDEQVRSEQRPLSPGKGLPPLLSVTGLRRSWRTESWGLMFTCRTSPGDHSHVLAPIWRGATAGLVGSNTRATEGLGPP